MRSFGTIGGVFRDKELGDEHRWIRKHEEMGKELRESRAKLPQSIAYSQLQSVLGNDAASISRKLKMRLVQWKLSDIQVSELGEQPNPQQYDYSLEAIPVKAQDAAYNYEYDPPLHPRVDKKSDEYKTLKRRIVDKKVSVEKHPSDGSSEKKK